MAALGEAPAAKHYHQAYRHGLLEHSLSVAQGVSALSATFPGIDRDVAVTGALLHDIGKIEAYAMTRRRDRDHRRRQAPGRDPARLLHGAPRDRGAAGLPAPRPRRPSCTSSCPTTASSSTARPVVPCTREATLVHMIDNLGGRLGSFDRIEKSLGDGERWSDFDRGISGSAYFGRARRRRLVPYPRRAATTPARHSAPPASASPGGVSSRISQPIRIASGGTR